MFLNLTSTIPTIAQPHVVALCHLYPVQTAPSLHSQLQSRPHPGSQVQSSLGSKGSENTTEGIDVALCHHLFLGSVEPSFIYFVFNIFMECLPGMKMQPLAKQFALMTSIRANLLIFFLKQNSICLFHLDV